MKKIQLSKGKFVMVDDDDYRFLNQYIWSACAHGPHGFKAVRAFTYIKNGKPTNRPILMHRIIMLSPPDEFEIDHIDGNSLNNQKSNLRICTHAQNMKNCRRVIPNTSRFLGVNFSKKYQKWRVRFQCERKTYLDKMMSSEVDAAKLYNKFSKKYNGEFARLNEV